MDQRKNLDEVSFIRPFLIFLLIVYHAFAPWCGAWEPFEGFVDNNTYWWIAKVAYSFMLQLFVFISGYVWEFQLTNRPERGNHIINLARNKFGRLYVPALFWGVLYWCVIDSNHTLTLRKSIEILSGYAHLWFLPMLFFCFIMAFYLRKVRRLWVQVFLIGVLFSFSVVDLPFGFSKAMQYVIYFYLGQIFFKYKDCIRVSKIRTACLFILFAIVFYFATEIENQLDESSLYDTITGRFFYYLILRFLRLIYGVIGIALIFFASILYTSRHEIAPMTIKISSYCFGIYILQQFILKLLYYKVECITIVNSLYVPWIGLLSTLLLSFFICVIIKKIPYLDKMI